ncbi:MAG: c-type cytochrome, partial [Nitrospirota bacterium]
MKCAKLLLVLFVTTIIYAGISQTTVYAASEGATLYAQYCASCHGATPSGAQVNASAEKITNAIATNSDMKNNASLKTLTSTQIQAIASFLSTSSATGSSLFLSNCISCHNTIPATDPRLVGATAAKITNAIATVSQMKGNTALQGLTSTQIQSISDYIVGTAQSSNWIIAGVGDFNGDGSVDIFWRDTINGYNYVWLMSGTSISSGLWLPTFTGNTWLVEGVGDFNQDGYADILLRNISTGENVIWLMKSGAIQSSITL